MISPLTPPSPLDGAPVVDRFALDNVCAVSPGRWRRDAVTIEVADGMIAAVRDAAGEEPGAAAQGSDRASFGGCVVLPGLVDCHQHLPRRNALELTGLFASLFLLHGVTAVRDAGDGDGTAVPALRRMLEAGTVPGPRVVACGPFIARTPLAWPNSIEVREPLDAGGVVQRAIGLGAQVLKLYDGLTASDIAALNRAAAEHGLPVIGHVPAALDYETAGVEHVQHFHGVPPAHTRRGDRIFNRLADWEAVDERRLDEIVKVTLDRGIANTPTLVVTEGVLLAQEPPAAWDAAGAGMLPRLYPSIVWNPRRGLAAYQRLSAPDLARLRDSLGRKLELVSRLHAAGARLHLGTDVQQPFVVPGVSLQREMALFVRAGVPVPEVWRLATVEAGRELGVPGLGTLEPGAPADLLVFDRDPTDNLDALGSLRAVIAGGRLLSVSELQHAVTTQLHHYRRRLVDWIAGRAASRAMAAMDGPR